MLELEELTLVGKDVALRPMERSDATDLSIAASESRASYGFTPVPRGVEEAESYVERALAQRARGERYPFSVVWDGAVVGTTSYYYFQRWGWPAASERAGRTAPDVTEIGGTWLSAAAQGTRCNLESKFLLLDHAFESWQALRVSFRTDARNARSRAAIERLGARLEGIIRAEKLAIDGSVRDSARYSIVLEEWPDVRRNLRSQLRARPRREHAGAVSP